MDTTPQISATPYSSLNNNNEDKNTLKITSTKKSIENLPHRQYGTKYNNPNLPSSVPIIGFGCSSFSSFFISNDDQILTCENISKSSSQVKEWINTIHHAIFNRGITLFDTAPWYGHGVSEVVVGYAFQDCLLEHSPSSNNKSTSNSNQQRIPRSSLIINTKIGRYEQSPINQFDYSYEKTIASAKLSVQRMNCLYIDVLQLHDPEYTPSIHLLLQQTIPAMIQCRNVLKIVKALGITGYPLSIQHEILLKVGTTMGMVFDQSLTYGHYNLHDSSLFVTPIDKSSKSFAEYCHENSITLLAAAPLSMGLLKDSSPPTWHPASQSLKFACQHANYIAQQKQVNLAKLATLFAFSHDSICCTLIGMGNIQQVDSACDAAQLLYDVDTDNTASTNDRLRQSKINSILQKLLTKDEYDVYHILQDEINGPFAKVWKSGEYQWDGIKDANDFWSMIPGGKTDAEKRMMNRFN